MNANSTSLMQCLRKLVAPPSCADVPDPQLLERFLTQRSETAFAALVQRHGPMVLSVCRRVLHHTQDAEDAFQATFLVLARKAGSIRKHESVGSWLHGVAYRVSRMSKNKETRRRVRQRGIPQQQPTEARDDIHWHELRLVLDEELGRLPEKYRAPLVLCYLEGRTRDEAAKQLGVSKAVFRRCLEYGRDQLGRQLARRGLALSAALSAPLLVDAATQAALPPLLVATTVRAGLASALGNTVCGIVSDQVITLAESGVGSLLAKKASIALVLLVSLTLGIGSLLAHRAAHSRTFAEAPAAQHPQSPPARSASKDQAVEIKGRVLDPEGKPLAGATVYFVPKDAKTKADLRLRAVTDKEGAFRLTAAPADMQSGAQLLATAAGHGPDWAKVSKDGETTLRLAKDDVPIQGRVIDLEGQPIAGVTVEASLLGKPVQGDLTPWLNNQTNQGRVGRRAEAPMEHLWAALLDGSHTAKTDAGGRFLLSGLGRERVVMLNVSGPTIESYSFVQVLTRSGPATGWSTADSRIYAASFDFAAAPCKPIVGTVRDRATGKPLAGIQVWEPFVMLAPNRLSVGRARTITDEKGRYRLTGIGKRTEYAIGAMGKPYFHVTKENVEDTPGLEPITVDFELTRGIPIRGRVTDKATGKPVRGRVRYLARDDNPHLKDYKDFGRGRMQLSEGSSEDGSFTAIAIPGPGYLCVFANHSNRYTGFELKDWDGSLLRTVPGGVHPSFYNAVIPIDVSAQDAKSTNIDIALEPGRTRTGTVVGPDGQPLAGALVAGLMPIVHSRKKLPDATFTAFGLNPRKSRNVVFFHLEKKLGKVQAVRGDEAGPLTVQLEPLGGVSGRVLDANGRPWAGLTVHADFRRPINAYKDLPGHELLTDPADPKTPAMEVKATTDRDGKFRLGGLLPGVPYSLTFSVDEIKRRTIIAAYPQDLTVESGKTRGLGDIRSEMVPEAAAEEMP